MRYGIYMCFHLIETQDIERKKPFKKQDKNFLKNPKKCLHFKDTCAKILEYVYCTYWYWYAMMREVAAHRGGEFPRSMSDLQTGRFDKPVRSRSPFAVPCYRIVFSCKNPDNIAKYFPVF